MNDNANLLQRARDITNNATKMSKPAATVWLKYRHSSIITVDPLPGEWCLWSVIIEGNREYGYGSILENGFLHFISYGGIGRFIKIDDTFYYAYVNTVNETN